MFDATMATNNLQQHNKTLAESGFEVFRTAGSRIVLADRVRENLIMDSGVSALVGEPLGIRVVVRAQQKDFPEESEASLFERAFGLGAPARQRGYVEADRSVVPIKDPSDESQVLDTWFEIAFEKSLDDSAGLDEELRYALDLVKTAG
jgi:hypothetical protein